MEEQTVNNERLEFETLREQIAAAIAARDMREVRERIVRLPPADIAELFAHISTEDKAIIFRIMPQDLATDTFEYFDVETQQSLLNALGDQRVADMLNEMEPDDRTALLEEMPAAAARQLLNLLSKEERAVALTLLGYPEHSVGRLMTPDYLIVKPDWSIEQVLQHVRENGKDTDILNILYVTDPEGKLVSDIRIREVLLSPPERKVNELMKRKFVALQAAQDQEEAVDVFKKYDRTALPVTDARGVMIGIVTVDDVFDVAEMEATEDIQKLGGTEALDEPYIKARLTALIKKRASWLTILFIGEMLTATAMGFYESEIARAVVLALFVPLIISSGGNSGSQAATLVIRAMALGEISTSDWWKVLRREVITGLCLGSILAAIGFTRIAVWSSFADVYGPHWMLVGLVVSASLIAVVTWGTITGAMLPLILKKLGADPATSSAPFVATLVDVTGLILYFTIGSLLLGGILL